MQMNFFKNLFKSEEEKENEKFCENVIAIVDLVTRYDALEMYRIMFLWDQATYELITVHSSLTLQKMWSLQDKKGRRSFSSQANFFRYIAAKAFLAIIFEEAAKPIISKHLPVLLKKEKELCVLDEYGDYDDSEYEKELKKYINEKLTDGLLNFYQQSSCLQRNLLCPWFDLENEDIQATVMGMDDCVWAIQKIVTNFEKSQINSEANKEDVTTCSYLAEKLYHTRQLVRDEEALELFEIFVINSPVLSNFKFIFDVEDQKEFFLKLKELDLYADMDSTFMPRSLLSQYAVDAIAFQKVALLTIISHQQILALKAMRLIRKDEYGEYNLKLWEKELIKYYQEKIEEGVIEFYQTNTELINILSQFFTTLDYREIMYPDKGSSKLKYYLTAIVKHFILTEQGQNSLLLDSQMSGHDYEFFISQMINDNSSWLAEVTKGSGDQGADIIITKNNITGVIQTKNYTGNVGNGAVQEAYAAQAHYEADFALVVTNASYTASAYELAEKTNIILLNDAELVEYLDHLPSPKEVLA